MSQREAALNLEWAQWNNVEWGANLPPIPGYPGTRYDGNVYAVVGPASVNGDVYGFRLHISISDDDNIVLDNRDFNIPNGTVEEMMQAVDNLSLRDIADMLDDMGYGPIDNPTASRHADKRTADLDLDWTRCLDDYAEYEAYLPALPGYPEMGDKDSLVYVAPVSDEYTFWMEIAVMQGQTVELTDRDFDIAPCGSAEEMEQAVASLTIQDILDALTAIGWGPDPADAAASRKANIGIVKRTSHKKGRHMNRKSLQRTAGMSLDWEDIDNGSAYEAELPAIPGYPGTWYATVAEDDDDYEGEPDYTWYFTIARKDVAGIQGVSILNNYVWNLEEADRPEEMMDFIENLTSQDIADKFAECGYAPADATASRKPRYAARRIASLDLDWEETESVLGDTLYQAVLPAIPGYPYSGDGNSTVTIAPDFYDSREGMYEWWMDIQVGEDENVGFTGYELTGMSSYPLDYQMGYLDGLSVEWIADKLAEKGYPPEED